MIKDVKFKKASDKEIFLYSCLGEALTAVQIIEDALSHSIVLKKTEPNQKKEADDLLKKQHRFTFGMSINVVKEESILPESLVEELTKFLPERNWLVHRSLTENKDEFKSDSFYKKISERTKLISTEANSLQIKIELEMIKYCEKKGIDMSRVKNNMNKHYSI